MVTFVPSDLSELREAVAEALAAEEPLEIVGGGSKRALGRPVQAAHTLDLSRLSGIRDYAPSELVLTAGAATPLAEIERALAKHNQMLAFEPPGWGGLLGVEDAAPTLGGALACNLSGPRRVNLSIRPGTAAFRVAGPAPSVAFRRDALLREHRESGAASTLDASGSLAFWRAIGEVAPLSALGERAVWRISVAPARGAAIGEALARSLDAVWYLDWGGGLLWLAVQEREDAGAQVIRAAIRGHDGHGTGHATLVKASPALRRGVPVFEPPPPPLAALSQRVKGAFDPRHILNPGRMVPTEPGGS